MGDNFSFNLRSGDKLPYVIKRALKASGGNAVGRIEVVALAYFPE